MGHETDNFYQDQFDQLDGKEQVDPELEKLRLKKELLLLELELQNGRLNHHHGHGGHEYRKHNERLPTTISPKILGGSKYHNGKIGSDYYKKLEKVRYTSNLRNGLQKNDSEAYITLDFGRRTAKVKVSYEGDHIIFEYRGYNQSVLLSRRNYNKPLKLTFGDRLTEKQRKGNKYGNFLEFVIKLDWR